MQKFIKLVKVGLNDPQMQPELSSEDLESAKVLWHKEVLTSTEDLQKSGEHLRVFEVSGRVLRC